MATIYPNKKDGKIISVKLKAYLGRDEQGKQIFRCKNWIPEKDMTEKKILALAEKEAILFEYEAAAQYDQSQRSPRNDNYISLLHVKNHPSLF